MAVEIATGIIALVPAKAPGFDGDLRRKFKDVKADVPLSADVPKFTADVTGKLRADKGSYTKAGKDIGEHIGDGMKAGADKSSKSGGGMLAGLGGMLAGGAIIATGIGAFQQYSDETEAAGKASIVFGGSISAVNELLVDNARKLGMSKLQVLNAAGGFGALFRAMKIGEGTSAEMSTTFVKLAADLGAFYNASNDDVLAALQSGIAGETEPLRRFGVNLNEARISAEALRLGLVKGNVNMVDVQAKQIAVAKAQQTLTGLQKSGKATAMELASAQSAVATAEQSLTDELAGKVAPLDAATKAQATYSLIMQDSALAQGNFAATADNAAQKSKSAAANVDDLKSKFGELIAPPATAFLGWAVTGLEAVKVWWDEKGPGIKQWFTDTFGTDPGANFRAGIEAIKGTLTSLRTELDMGAISVNERATPAWNAIGEKVLWVKNSVLDPLWGTLQTGVPELGKTFGQLWEWLEGLFSMVKEKALDPLVGVTQTIIDKLKAITDNPIVRALNPATAGAGGLLGDLLKNLLGFDTGGIVPGRTGAPMLAMVHGGETILPTHRMGIGTALSSFGAPAPAGGYGAPIVIENLHVGPGDSRTRATDVVHELRGLGLRTRGGT